MDSRTEGYARGLFAIALAEGELDRVREEVTAIGQAVEASPELRDALANPQLPGERKQSILGDILGGRAASVTANFMDMLISMGRGTDLPAVATALVGVAAADRNREVAEVRVPYELDEETSRKLVDGLERATGKKLELRVVVDPSVVGGVSARVGDQVIDGSLRHRLDTVRQALRN